MKFYLQKQSINLGIGVMLLLLLIGFAPPAAAQSLCGNRINVVYGDTLQQIAARCNTTVAAVLQLNPVITNPDLIYPGQRLVIPGQERLQRISIPDRQSQPYVLISPTNGPPGTAVQLTAGGFPANTRINIRIGWANPGAYYRVVDVGFTSTEGTFGGQVTIPVFARPGQTWVVVITVPQQSRLTTFSNVFDVTGVAGQAQVPTQSP